MKHDSNPDEASFGIFFADTLLQFLIFILIMFVLVLAETKQSTSTIETVKGQVCAELSWPNDRDIDMDLWGKAPGERLAVGFSNMHSKRLNLYRDVLGWFNNPSHVNLEMMCSDTIVPGEWTFNAVLFRFHEEDNSDGDHNYHGEPVEAILTVVIQYPNASDSMAVIKKIYVKKKIFTYTGEEHTMLNFVISKDGRLDLSTINDREKDIKAITQFGDIGK